LDVRFIGRGTRWLIRRTVGNVAPPDSPSAPHAMLWPHRRLAAVLAMFTVGSFACELDRASRLDPARRAAIADTLTSMIKSAYDLKAKDVVSRFMSLYPDSGRVISASGGRVTTTRDSVESGIKSFWTNVGQRMQNPTWIWGRPLVDVLSPDAAVVTMTYRVPHRTPEGAPHTIAGAWTAVFERRAGKWVIVQEHLSEVPPEVMEGDTADVPAAHAHH
jgi:ketosteroid isomerase-like protein